MRALEILLERNVLNVDELQKFVQQVAARARTPGVQQYLQRQLLAFLIKRHPRSRVAGPQDLSLHFHGSVPAWAAQGLERGDLHIVDIDDALRTTVGEVVDWLESEDAHGVNLTRMPFEAAIQRAREWHRQLAQQPQEVSAGAEDGVEVIHRYPTGHQWVKLMTPDALDYEGSQMGHCVGRGSYDGLVASGSGLILSLRDANGEPHVTIEVDRGELKQVKGKQNKPPVARYRKAVLDILNNYLRKLGVDGTECYDLQNLAIYQGAKGFGDLLDVAAATEDFEQGYKLVLMGPITQAAQAGGKTVANLYIADHSGRVVASMQEVNGVLDSIQIKKDLTSHRAIRHIVEEVADRSPRIDSGVRHYLYTALGILVDADDTDQKTGKTAVVDLSDAKLVVKDNLCSAYLVPGLDDESKGEMFILDAGNHPLITIAFDGLSNRSISMGYVSHTENDYGAGLKTLSKALEILGGTRNVGQSLTRLYREAGWVPVNGKFKPLDEVASTEYMKSAQGVWLQIDGELLLRGDNGLVKASLTTEPDPEDDEYTQITGIVSEYVLTAREFPVAEDIADLINYATDLTFPEYYDDEHFLLEYNVYVDDGHATAIDMKKEYEIEEEYTNKRSDPVGERTYRDTLGSFIDSIGYSDAPDYLGQYFFPELLNYGRYQHTQNEEEDSSINENVAEAYEDPEGYLKQNRLKRLPMIVSTTYTISQIDG